MPEHNEEIELSIEFPVVMMVGSNIWTSHQIFKLFRKSWQISRVTTLTINFYINSSKTRRKTWQGCFLWSAVSLSSFARATRPQSENNKSLPSFLEVSQGFRWPILSDILNKLYSPESSPVCQYPDVKIEILIKQSRFSAGFRVIQSRKKTK